MSLPEQLLLSDLLRLRVRCDQGLDHGTGVAAWMHPPVHRLLGWVSRPSLFRTQRRVWRLDQLRGVTEVEAFVKGEGADTEASILERLPTLIDATLLGAAGQPLARVADAAVELRSGRILHYLVARSDPRLPGSSRWRLSPDRILDQRPGRIETALRELDDLPLARASMRQDLLRRSRQWRDQMGEETSRLRQRMQQAGDRFEERLEGWLEEPPWDEVLERGGKASRSGRGDPGEPFQGPDPLEEWDEDPLPSAAPGQRPRAASRSDAWPEAGWAESSDSRWRAPVEERRPGASRREESQDDPWI